MKKKEKELFDAFSRNLPSPVKLNASWSTEAGSELTTILSKEIEKEINEGIIKELNKIARFYNIKSSNKMRREIIEREERNILIKT